MNMKLTAILVLALLACLGTSAQETGNPEKGFIKKNYPSTYQGDQNSEKNQADNIIAAASGENQADTKTINAIDNQQVNPVYAKEIIKNQDSEKASNKSIPQRQSRYRYHNNKMHSRGRCQAGHPYMNNSDKQQADNIISTASGDGKIDKKIIKNPKNVNNDNTIPSEK